MHIRQIVIQGFKSYREQTPLEPFSPGHNVVVGRNGSGKSNFFWAIRFVLGDALVTMDKETRQSLLHEGTGAPTLSAYVELVFDNTDQRFPTGRNELVLRRTIGLKKDEYSLDHRTTTKAEVFALLESAGFSKANPYYIVPQGRVTALTVAKDSERLQLLKDVAGTKVYEQRRQESLKTMAATDFKRERIEELLDNIDGRLQELQQETSELEGFHEKDRERRSLEYVIYSREQAEAATALGDLDDERKREVDGSIATQANLTQVELEMEQLESHISEEARAVDAYASEKLAFSAQRDSLLKEIARLELLISDLRNGSGDIKKRKAAITTELASLKSQVAEKKAQLEQLEPEYSAVHSNEKEIERKLASVEMKRESLYGKQGRNTQFKSKAERDEFISSKIAETESALTAERVIFSSLETEIGKLAEESKDTETKIEQQRADILSSRERIEALGKTFQELRLKRSALDEERNRERLAEHRLLAGSGLDEFRKADRAMFTICPRVVARGIKTVEYLSQRLGISGVYGPLYKLFDVDETYSAACESIAGNALFHVVVETDEVAHKLLEAMNNKSYQSSELGSNTENVHIGGRVTFMPLNRMREQGATPMLPADDAVPIISKLTFDDKYDRAVRHVFGNGIVCPSLSLAGNYARKFGVIAVTLDGDRADKRGALTGGFKEARRSRLDIIRKYKALSKEAEQNASALRAIHAKVEYLDQSITKIRDEMNTTENERRTIERSRPALLESNRLLSKELESVKELISNKTKLMEKSSKEISLFEERLAQLQTEKSSTFSKSLSMAEEKMLQELSIEFQSLSDSLAAACKERIRIEQQMNTLRFEISSHLEKRIDELMNESNNFGKGSVGNEILISQRNEELNAISQRLHAVEDDISRIDKSVDELRKGIKAKRQQLDKAAEEHRKASKLLENYKIEIEKYAAKRANLLRRRAEAVRNIRELGALPEGAFEKYNGVSIDQLVQRLHHVNDDLKVYGHVNKKAHDQYSTFTKQRDQLISRKDELDQSAASIQELIADLDRRKDEAISRTFKQVGGYFSEIWERLVPQGHGELVMQVSEDAANSSGDEISQENSQSRRRSSGRRSTGTKSSRRSQQQQVSEIEKYSGIAIKVSFHSKHDQGLLMNQLSGGQKSLVALALIFAIQRCDPAPFYLFDEIDAALDTQYRQSVASMIHELSRDAQFITTTFRPELLTSADKFYGVTFVGKVSKVVSITKEEATQFVEQSSGLVQ